MYRIVVGWSCLGRIPGGRMSKAGQDSRSRCKAENCGSEAWSRRSSFDNSDGFQNDLMIDDAA